MGIVAADERDAAIGRLALPPRLVEVASGRGLAVHPAFNWIGEVEAVELESAAGYPHPDGVLTVLGYYDECTYLAARSAGAGWELIEFVQGESDFRRVAGSEVGFFAWVFAVMLRSGPDGADLDGAAGAVGFPYLPQLREWSADSRERYPGMYEEPVRCALAADSERLAAE